MEAKSVDFVYYTVSELDESVSFYRDTLGLHLETHGEGWAEFAIPPTTLMLDEMNQHTPMSPGGGGVGLGLAVDDVERATSELRDEGMTVLKEPFDAGVCDMAMVCDPDENPIILHRRHDGTYGRRDPFP